MSCRTIKSLVARLPSLAFLHDPAVKRRFLIAVPAAVVIIGIAVGASWWVSRPLPGRVVDEARSAGYTTFAAPGEDYFHEMDGRADLSLNEIKGRNLWMAYSGGNDRFWDHLARQTGGAFDLLKLVSSYDPEIDPRASAGQKESLKALYTVRHRNRFAMTGVLNEPCYEQPTEAVGRHFGLWLDARDASCIADPFEDYQRYLGVQVGARGRPLPLGSLFGYPSGVIGLRLFPNPDFDSAAARRWDAERYYTDPSYYGSPDLVRPYRVGMTCAFCHVGLNPDHMPESVENPRWENLSSIAGAQFLRMDRVGLWQQDRPASSGRCCTPRVRVRSMSPWRPRTTCSIRARPMRCGA